MAVITALRGVDGQQTEAMDEPMLLRPGVERC